MQRVQLRVLIGALGLLSVISAGAVHAASATRTSSFDYDPVSGLLSKEVIEPDDSNLCLVTTYTRDGFGNVVSTTTRNCNGSSGEAGAPSGDAVIAARTSTTGFDSKGQFPTSSTNALNQSEARAYDPNFGGMVSLTGPNTLTTTWQYDSFGRKVREIRADGTQTKWDYVLCSGIGNGTAACPTVGAGAATYYIQVTPLASDGVTANGVWTKSYFDMLDRVIRTETQGLDGRSIYQDTYYDSLGRVAYASRPYYAGGSAQWTSYSYDALSRVVSETAPDGSSLTRSYNALTLTTTHSPSGQRRIETKNSQGQLAWVADAMNNVLSYSYDPFGNLTRTTDALGNQTQLSYDRRGRKTAMLDPDMRAWSYAYDALGQLIRQTDAKGQVVSMAYDKLGRMVQRAEPDLISTWYYDAYYGGAPCTKGIGKLCETRADNNYRQTYSYDSLGRMSSVSTYVDNPATPYTVGASYDANGRLTTQSYPTGFAVRYLYNAFGYLTDVRRNDNNALLWQVNAMDAEGHLLQQTHGNNVLTSQSFDAQTGRLLSTVAGASGAVQNLSYQYSSDKLGNLASRQDANFSQGETFQYDSLNRLVVWQTQGAGIAETLSKIVTYNAIGNITSKSDVGGYVYNPSGAGSVRPHAVASISGQVNGVVNPNFIYDDNGNLIAGAGHALTYTSYNQVSSITQGTNTLSFLFDSAHQRMKETGPNDTTIFVIAGGLHYEKKTQPSGLVVHQHFIQAYGMMVALYVTKTDTTTQTRYFHLDHLGSIRVISNETGSVVERLSYDPWGKRRFANGNDDPGNTITSAVTDRGFTGQEHLDEVGLIHMNGRVYDPLLGRFVSPDPTVPDVDDLQQFNRYSYAANNPLSNVDPTGFDDYPIYIVVPTVTVIAAPELLLSPPILISAPWSPVIPSIWGPPLSFGSNPFSFATDPLGQLSSQSTQFANALAGQSNALVANNLNAALAAMAPGTVGFVNDLRGGSPLNLQAPGMALGAGKSALSLAASLGQAATVAAGQLNPFAGLAVSLASPLLNAEFAAVDALTHLNTPSERAGAMTLELVTVVAPIVKAATVARAVRAEALVVDTAKSVATVEKAPVAGKRTFSAVDRAAGLERAKDAAGVPRCQYCGTELDPSAGRPNSYEADHTMPYSRGGPSAPENLTPSCRTCNRSKGAQTLEDWGGP